LRILKNWGNINKRKKGAPMEDLENDMLDDSCPGCDSRPGDGYTADCHDPEGCGYYKKEFGALSNRFGELKY
jgi:hypothetical protein